jgi:uncharacterized protein involved in response to NO
LQAWIHACKDMKEVKQPMLSSRLFFRLATLHALLTVTAWQLWPLPATWHGHEMLFGFALAVVAGFLVTRPSRRVTQILVISWLAARAAPILPAGPLSLVVGLAFPAALLAATVPTLLGSAKRWENRIAPLVLVTLLLADLAWWAGQLWFGLELQQRALLVAIDLFALLLIFGGRALQAAMGGYLERRGLSRRDPVRSGHERPLALLLLGAVLADAGSFPTVAGLCSLGAALLTLHRVIPWQLQHMFREARLWTLGIGYLWLIIGLLAKGIAQLHAGIPVAVMLHALTIGGLGTLTLVMMARTASLRSRQSLDDFRMIGIAVLLLGVAAVSRLLAGFGAAHHTGLLWLSALGWSLAFLLLLVRLSSPGNAPGSGTRRP